MSKALELALMTELMAKCTPTEDAPDFVDDMWNVTNELRRLAEIEQAALKLIKCKGRYHTEQNMIALGELLGVKMPPATVKKD